MSISFKDINSLNNGKLEYFQETFNNELKKKNFLGNLFSDIYSTGETTFNFYFAFIITFLVTSIFIEFKILLFAVPFFIFMFYFTYKYNNMLKKINLSKKTVKINFARYMYNEEDIKSINNKINKLSKADIELLNKVSSNAGSLKRGSKNILYDMVWSKLYWSNLDEIKENKDIIFNYLKSKHFKELSDYSKNNMIEKVEEKMDKATHSDKVALLEEKYNKNINNDKKLIKEI